MRSGSRSGRGRLGIRGRLILVVLGTILTTLATASLVVLPALQSRLDHDRVSDLRGLVRLARPSLHALPAEAVRRGSPQLLAIVEDLQERTGGRIAIYDQAGVPLADTAPVPRAPAVQNLPALRQAARSHRDRVVAGKANGRVFAVADSRAGTERLAIVIVKRLDDTRAAAAVLRGALPLAALLAIVLGAALGLALSRTLVRRLTLLHADAHALGTEGLDHEVHVVGDDEIAEVAGALEEMRARLAEEETSRQAFISTASHELRTPLASLQASLELLREEVGAGTPDPGRAVARVDTAMRQTHRLVGLAGDLLDLSRVDGHVPLRAEPVELRELVAQVGREFAERLAADGRELSIDIDAPVIALADPTAVVRIVRILVDNARAYGGGRVTIAAVVHEGEIAVSVTDEGPGLSPGERDVVFQRFARGAAAHEQPGAGLGLPIARGLAREMGGGLEADDVPAGARFVVRLPLWHGE